MVGTSLLCARDLRLDGIGQSDIELTLKANARVGLLGAAGSGKTRLLRTLARLDVPPSGKVWWENVEVSRRSRWWLGQRRTFVTLILANPYTTFEPWAPVERVLPASPRQAHETDALFQALALPEAIKSRRVRNLSGVQRATLSLARALLNHPRVLLVDDIFDMLMPETWAALTQKIVRGAGAESAVLIASRHWAVMKALDYVYVLRAGEIIEAGAPQELAEHSQYPYTQTLIASGKNAGMRP